MALNKTIYQPNPLKSKTYGLNDVIRRDNFGYSTIYTVTSGETLKLSNGFFSIDYLTAGVAAQIEVNIALGTKVIGVYKAYVPVTTRASERFTLQDLGINDIFLSTGDAITVQFTHDDATSTPTGNILATLYFEDYTV
jgi:hypothetical protein